jgi:hypothetical protein
MGLSAALGSCTGKRHARFPGRKIRSRTYLRKRRRKSAIASIEEPTMLRILTIASVVLVAGIGGAAASDCLTLVDGLSVEYDLPAATSLADPPIAADDSRVLNTRPIEGEGTIERTTPPGRPGLARLTNPGPAPVFSEHSKLSSSQRTQVQDLLHRARSAEALGNEDECMAAFTQAKAVLAPATAPAKPSTHRKGAH